MRPMHRFRQLDHRHPSSLLLGWLLHLHLTGVRPFLHAWRRAFSRILLTCGFQSHSSASQQHAAALAPPPRAGDLDRRHVGQKLQGFAGRTGDFI